MWYNLLFIYLTVSFIVMLVSITYNYIAFDVEATPIYMPLIFILIVIVMTCINALTLNIVGCNFFVKSIFDYKLYKNRLYKRGDICYIYRNGDVEEVKILRCHIMTDNTIDYTVDESGNMYHVQEKDISPIYIEASNNTQFKKKLKIILNRKATIKNLFD